MATYAIVNNSTNIVENHIEWDGITEYEPPEGTTLMKTIVFSDVGYKESDFVDIGYIWDGNSFHAPEPTPTPQPTLAELQAQLATLAAQIQALSNT